MKPLTIDEIRRDVAQAVKQWQPDQDCLAAGDRYLALAVSCWISACLTEHQIAERLRAFAGQESTP